MRAVIFDFDGVLVDSEPVHYRAMRESLRKDGITIDREEYVRHYVGYEDRTAIRLAFERRGKPADLAQVHDAAERKAGLYQELLAEIPFFRGARELVRALAAEVPLAIASGARRKEIERILAAAGLRDAFAAVVGADDVAHTKPHPEPYLTALRGLATRARDLAPEQCLVVEDSTAGIAAGRAAGMRVLAVAHTYPADRLRGAHSVVDTLDGLSPAALRALFA